MPTMPKRHSSSTDKYVGSRVRLFRIKLKLTQQGLAERLGISFQQVQKYEKGANRMGASRLQHLAQIFNVPVHFFFDGAPRLAVSAGANKEDPSVNHIDDFPAGPEGKALARAFLKIKDPMVRRSIVHMVQALAPGGPQERFRPRRRPTEASTEKG
jgi:transcriptional regulator with XRE-family HTH domain